MDNTDRLLNKIISVLLFTVLLIMLTVGSIFIMPPSFADSLDVITVPNVSSSSSSDVRSDGFLFLDINAGWYCGFTTTSSTVPDVYLFYYLNGSNYRPCFVSSDNTVTCYISNSTSNVTSYSSSSFDSTYELYYLSLNSNTFTSAIADNYYTYPLYNSIDAGLSAIRDYIDNAGGASIIPSPATIIVRPGNVAYIGYNEGYCNLSVRLSNAVKTYSSNVRIGYSASRPAEGSTLYYDNSTGNSVSWTNSQPRDILGRSTYFIYHETFNSIGYFIIYNPAYDDAGNVNNSISAEFSAYTSVVQFPLTTSLVDGSTVSTGNSDEFYMSQGEEMMSTPGVPTYIYTDTNGVTSSAIEVPASQYNYYAPEENEEGLLSGFVQRIVNLLSAPVKHIQNLFNEGLTFMTWLSGLWSWLPVEVVGILTSALVVLIVVGVIKVFWK